MRGRRGERGRGGLFTVVLIKPIQESSHAEIPQLDDAIVKRHNNPWALGI